MCAHVHACVCDPRDRVSGLDFSVSQVLPACHTWYDHVWAYFKTLVDVQVEKVIVWCCLTACPATTGLISGPRHCAAE